MSISNLSIESFERFARFVAVPSKSAKRFWKGTLLNSLAFISHLGGGKCGINAAQAKSEE
ncbi:MAG: hypothetical protein ACHBN1_10680 [Heteroscytonema crispum UTEX LB 1556]